MLPTLISDGPPQSAPTAAITEQKRQRLGDVDAEEIATMPAPIATVPATMQQPVDGKVQLLNKLAFDGEGNSNSPQSFTDNARQPQQPQQKDQPQQPQPQPQQKDQQKEEEDGKRPKVFIGCFQNTNIHASTAENRTPSPATTPITTPTTTESVDNQRPIEPDHFYDNGGVPVFRPAMEDFKNFSQFMQRIDAFGQKSGIGTSPSFHMSVYEF
jgi:hypothetical protein